MESCKQIREAGTPGTEAIGVRVLGKAGHGFALLPVPATRIVARQVSRMHGRINMCCLQVSAQCRPRDSQNEPGPWGRTLAKGMNRLASTAQSLSTLWHPLSIPTGLHPSSDLECIDSLQGLFAWHHMSSDSGLGSL